ncbi:MAG: group II intron maturase-specific domain-containing protein, partial [Planctomycetota bacterium]
MAGRLRDKSLDDLARMLRSVLSGWIAYYGKYYRSALSPVFRRLNRRLARWVQKKYKRLSRQRRATH